MGFLDRLLDVLLGPSKPDKSLQETDAKVVNQKFRREERYRPEEELEDLKDAEDIFREPTETKQVIEYVTARRGEEIVTKSETQNIRHDGSAEAKTIIRIPVAACGKKISKDEIAGFCDVCDEAVCSEHAQYCSGYKSIPCRKLLCPKHTFDFTERDGTQLPCCSNHYDMRVYRQENIDFEEPAEKPTQSKKEEDQDD